MDKDQLKEVIKDYFKNCDNLKSTYTLPGLAEALGWSVQEIMDYPIEGDFFKVIEYAKIKCENSIIDGALKGRVDKGTANIILKTHFGYKDKKEVEVKGKLSISKVLDELENASS